MHTWNYTVVTQSGTMRHVQCSDTSTAQGWIGIEIQNFNYSPGHVRRLSVFMNIFVYTPRHFHCSRVAQIKNRSLSCIQYECRNIQSHQLQGTKIRNCCLSPHIYTSYQYADRYDFTEEKHYKCSPPCVILYMSNLMRNPTTLTTHSLLWMVLFHHHTVSIVWNVIIIRGVHSNLCALVGFIFHFFKSVQILILEMLGARALHFVLKIGDRGANAHFFRTILGMKVRKKQK